MSVMTTARTRTEAVRPAPAGASEAQAEDFAALLLHALDDALDAMAHPVPDQYLHLLAARRRGRPAAARSYADSRAEARAVPEDRNAALLLELSGHLAFEFLNSARRYATLLGSIGDYEGAARHSALSAHRRECARSP